MYATASDVLCVNCFSDAQRKKKQRKKKSKCHTEKYWYCHIENDFCGALKYVGNAEARQGTKELRDWVNFVHAVLLRTKPRN